MEKLSELKRLITSIEEDSAKFFEKGTKAAGVRVRKGLQEIKKVAQEMRIEISEQNKK